MKGTLRLAHVVLLLASAGCGGSPSSPTGAGTTRGAQQPTGINLEIWSVEVNRWAQTGAYDYNVTYRVQNLLRDPVTVSVSGAELFGPDGEALGGLVNRFSSPAAVTIAPGEWSRYDDETVDDLDASHPYAEQLRLSVSYQVGSTRRTVTATAPVLHGPQTARLLDFSVSPLDPLVGDTITVRWNVQSARRVKLQTPISWDSNKPDTFQFNVDQEVEPVGARTLVVRRTGLVFVTLEADTVIRRSIQVSPRR
jgi:hypothetical protein